MELFLRRPLEVTLARMGAEAAFIEVEEALMFLETLGVSNLLLTVQRKVPWKRSGGS